MYSLEDYVSGVFSEECKDVGDRGFVWETSQPDAVSVGAWGDDLLWIGSGEDLGQLLDEWGKLGLQFSRVTWVHGAIQNLWIEKNRLSMIDTLAFLRPQNMTNGI